MKKIIIPTRCTEHAVHLFRLATKLYSNEGFHCTFLQVVPIPENESDLLTLGRQPAGYIFSDESLSEIRKMENEFAHVIKGYSIDRIYGDSPAVFKQYIQEFGADMVFYSREEWQEARKSLNLDVFRMLCRSRCPIMYIAKSDLANISEELLQPQTRAYHTAREMSDAVSLIDAAKAKDIPEALVYQFNAVEKKLSGFSEMMQNKDIPTVKMGKLSSYFMREQRLERILMQSNVSLLLLTI
ncbi:hypothetical protein [Sediminibacterium sp.]|uniref:hypothetical protein n=1 Tax=Sediminibacterium sp. TaxID=1917865 RepID=UPI0025FCE8CF|nr:hypothetical protein [Sediminibacterium sp.]MBW0177851.1 hypothetical protein [Sediminibacterium sp.]